MLWLAVVGFVLTLLVTAALFWFGAWNPPKRREIANDYPVFQELPKIVHVAHRGGSRIGPQNTMAAYRLAVEEYGADVLEIDLQLSQDGHIVLIHDGYVLHFPAELPAKAIEVPRKRATSFLTDFCP